MPTKWSHLPNAPHIDRVLAHVKAHPDRWIGAYNATLESSRGAVWFAASAPARDAASGAARDAAWNEVRRATLEAARGYAWIGPHTTAWGAARGYAVGIAMDATTTLVAWDDCANILDMPADAVRQLVARGHHPAVLLLPAVLAMEERV
jgi:hypothetical protein